MNIKSKNVIKFTEEIEVICKKYGYSIDIEDPHCGFVIKDYSEDKMNWFKDCSDETTFFLKEYNDNE